MFKDLLEALKILKPSAPTDEKLEMEKTSNELDLLARANRFTNEGVVPANASKDEITNIIKKLTEMAVKVRIKEEGEEVAPSGAEAPAGEAPAIQPKEGKIYFGASGQNIYYADLVKDSDSKQIQSLKLYDVTDQEVKSYEDLAEQPNAEVLYQVVNDLNLDSVSYQMLMDLNLLVKPEEEEKPEEEPKAEEPAEEKPEEEKPEEKPEEEKPEDNLPPQESVKEASVDTKQEPKKAPALNLDNQTPATDKIDTAGAASTPANPVSQGDSSINKDAGPTGSDPNLGKDDVKKEGDIKLEDQDPEKVKQGAPVKVAKIEGAVVVSDAVVKEAGSPAAATDAKPADLKKDNVAAVGGGVQEPTGQQTAVKQDKGALDVDVKGDKEPKPDGTTVVAKTDVLKDSLDVQAPGVYEKEIAALQQKLEKKEITQADFESGKLDLDKKYKAQPAGTTEGVVPSNPAGAADDKMIKELLEKHGLTKKK